MFPAEREFPLPLVLSCSSQPDAAPEIGRRLRLPLASAFLGSAILLPLVVTDAATAHSFGSELTRFKYAVATVESNGRYTARNPQSGAYGKYQIMPFNWPAWAERYLGDARARPTPANQERVASGKFTSLYEWLRSWRRVAYWWLTGSSKPESGWSSFARGYVEKVMAIYSGSADPVRRKDPGSASGSSSRSSGGSAVTGVRWTTGYLYLRTGPSPKYAASDVLAPGTMLRVLTNDTTSRWLRVRVTNGQTGWVDASYTRHDGESASRTGRHSDSSSDSSRSGARNSGTRVTTGYLYFRAGPGRGYTAITVLAPGTRLKPLSTGLSADTRKLWLRVRLRDGRTGWVDPRYTR